jgi:hypothetical protein
MIAVTVALITFVCVAGGALVGLLLGAVLTPRHLESDSKDTVKLGMGLVATMTAILLGLLIASAKSFYDTQNAQITEMSSKVILLDRVLAHYGPETKEARELLRSAVSRVLDALLRKGASADPRVTAAPSGSEILYDKIQALSPQNDAQRVLQNQAISVAVDLAKTRWLMVQQSSTSVSPPLLGALVCWLVLIFFSFGLLAPRTPIVAVTLCLCALAVSSAIFLVIDMYSPFSGVVRVSSVSLQTALDRLGK